MSQTDIAIFVHLRKTVSVSLDGLRSLQFVRDWPDPMQILLYVSQYIIQFWQDDELFSSNLVST